MQISVIIPAYNEEQLIGACIDSVVENGNRHLTEIIVLDNASTDRTASVAASKGGIRVVREDRKGVAHARERGRKEAKGELIAFLDADSRLGPKWAEKVERAFQSNPNVVALSGPAEYFDASLVQRILLRFVWRVVAPITYKLTGYMIFGAHFVVKRSALDTIGGFDLSIDFYGDDTSLARRLSATGSVLFQMDFPVVTSSRRFRAEGFIRTNCRYALNFLWPVWFGRPFSHSHKDVR